MPTVMQQEEVVVAEPLLIQFRQLFFICKVLGIYPHNWDTFHNKHVLEKSKYGLWYVLLTMAIYVLLYNLLIFSFGEEDRTLKASQSTLTLVIGLFLTYIGLIMMITDQVTALMNQTHLGELYERIRIVDERLLKENCVINNNNMAVRIRFMVLMTIAFELTIVLSTYIKLVDYSQIMSLLWIVLSMPTLINSLDKIWFAVSLYALKQRFEAINIALEKMVLKHERFKAWQNGGGGGGDGTSIIGHTIDADLVFNAPQYEHNLEYLYKELGGLEIGSLKGSAKNKITPIAHSMNSFGETVVSPPYKTHSNIVHPAINHESELNNIPKLEEKLNNLCQVHDEICEIGKKLNELWSYPILILMAYGFLIFTAQLYFLYCATQDQVIPSLFRSAKNAVITIIALSYTSGKCIYLIYLSWKTSLASKRTGISLHKCGVVADDNLVYEIVNHLSLKLLNHSVDFSACGFFTLDMETLYGVSGGITSYLIILIQFNLAAQQAKDAIQTFNSNNDTSNLVGAATTAEIDAITTTTTAGYMTTTSMTSIVN